MNKQLITSLTSTFEEHAQNQAGVEFWYARDLQKLLEYQRWNKFMNVIDKAQIALKNAGENVEDHMFHVEHMVSIGSGAERKVEDILLTRYACYLIAQNADPSKEAVAFAQSYFAVQTRKQEIIEERIKLAERLEARERLTATETTFSKLIYERGVDERGFGRIRSKGDQALFGGLTTQEMKNKLIVPNSRPLADFLPTVTILSKALATEITNVNIQNKNLQGEKIITDEHIDNNQKVRNALLQSGIIPEELPAEEDIKKLQRRVKSQDKNLVKSVSKLK